MQFYLLLSIIIVFFTFITHAQRAFKSDDKQGSRHEVDTVVAALVKCQINNSTEVPGYEYQCPLKDNPFLLKPGYAQRDVGFLRKDQVEFIQLKLGVAARPNTAVKFAVRYLVQQTVFKGKVNELNLLEPTSAYWLTILPYKGNYRGLMYIWSAYYLKMVAAHKVWPAPGFYEWLDSSAAPKSINLSRLPIDSTPISLPKSSIRNGFTLTMLNTTSSRAPYVVNFKKGYVNVNLAARARSAPIRRVSDPASLSNFDFDKASSVGGQLQGLTLAIDYTDGASFYENLQQTVQGLPTLLYYRKGRTVEPYDSYNSYVARHANSTDAKSGDTFIYVMDSTFQFYVALPSVGKFNHLSFLAGGQVLCAGHVKFTNGYISYIDNYSSEYHPTVKHFRVMLQILNAANVNFQNTKIREFAVSKMRDPHIDFQF